VAELGHKVIGHRRLKKDDRGETRPPHASSPGPRFWADINLGEGRVRASMAVTEILRSFDIPGDFSSTA